MSEHHIPWDRLLIRTGFNVVRRGDCVDFSSERHGNRFLFKRLCKKVRVAVRFREGCFRPESLTFDERAWLAAYDEIHGGKEAGEPWLETRQVELYICDAYIAGIVRWLIAAGLRTTMSCDGHGKSLPYIDFADPLDASAFRAYLKMRNPIPDPNQSLLVNPRFPVEQKSPSYDRCWLLDLAEDLYAAGETLRTLRKQIAI